MKFLTAAALAETISFVAPVTSAFAIAAAEEIRVGLKRPGRSKTSSPR
jgi:hypothetical protein